MGQMKAQNHGVEGTAQVIDVAHHDGLAASLDEALQEPASDERIRQIAVPRSVLAGSPLAIEEQLARGSKAQRQLLHEGGDLIARTPRAEHLTNFLVGGLAGHQPQRGARTVPLLDDLDLAQAAGRESSAPRRLRRVP